MTDVDLSEKTCLDNSINAGNIEITKFLQEKLVESITQVAKENNHEKLESLLRSVDIDSFDFVHPDMLYTSIMNGNIETVKVLFKFGATSFLSHVNSERLNPAEALFFYLKQQETIKEDYFSLINFLFSKGAIISLEENGKTLDDFCGNNKKLLSNLLDIPLAQLNISIDLLPKIKFLDLSDSDIKTVPQSVFKLTYLERLQLANNGLTILPSFLAKLQHLKWSDLDWSIGNSLSSIPFGILGKKIKFLFNNYL